MIGTCKDCVYCAMIQRNDSRPRNFCALHGKYMSDIRRLRRCYMTVTVTPLRQQTQKTGV